jgi:formate dehydrogenase maturation protein FdhE
MMSSYQELIEKKDRLEALACNETDSYLKQFYLNALNGTFVEIEKFRDTNLISEVENNG